MSKEGFEEIAIYGIGLGNIAVCDRIVGAAALTIVKHFAFCRTILSSCNSAGDVLLKAVGVENIAHILHGCNIAKAIVVHRLSAAAEYISVNVQTVEITDTAAVATVFVATMEYLVEYIGKVPYRNTFLIVDPIVKQIHHLINVGFNGQNLNVLCAAFNKNIAKVCAYTKCPEIIIILANIIVLVCDNGNTAKLHLIFSQEIDRIYAILSFSAILVVVYSVKAVLVKHRNGAGE